MDLASIATDLFYTFPQWAIPTSFKNNYNFPYTHTHTETGAQSFVCVSLSQHIVKITFPHLS